MTNSEFSDSFDTLLNSYASQAQFGDQAGKSEIVLDEYEKSVLLTQAQDIVVKSFFDRRHNSQGDGFDDSTRRQVDFSSLITTAVLQESSDQSSAFDDRGIIYKMPLRKYPTSSGRELVGTLSPTLGSQTGISNAQKNEYYFVLSPSHIQAIRNEEIIFEGVNTTTDERDMVAIGDAPASYSGRTFPEFIEIIKKHPVLTSAAITVAESDASELQLYTPSTGWQEKEGTTDVLFILNEQLKCRLYDMTKNYVVVPINYKEYDREMSKAYAQPLKKQAWRLFQNSSQGFDIQSELIPRWNLKEHETIEGYKVRYIRRPCPIVLVDLPNGLEIDGFTKSQECELNPILHPEILQKALELAISTRGGRTAVRQQEQT